MIHFHSQIFIEEKIFLLIVLLIYAQVYTLNSDEEIEIDRNM